MKLIKRFQNRKTENLQIRICLLICLMFFIVVNQSCAQESVTLEFQEMEERSLKSRKKTPEPDFLFSQSSLHKIGFYFGVGFRSLKFEIENDQTVTDENSTSNGIGFDLGYWWDEQFFEYERQISIIDTSKTLTHENNSGQRLEVIQNNLWYAKSPKISSNLNLHYGAGIQFTKTRFAATSLVQSYTDEAAMGLLVGASYLVTQNMLLTYRYSLGQRVPLLNADNSNPFLKESQIQTIFLNYFFPL